MFEFLKKDSVKSININEIDDLIGKVNVIDVREPHEFKNGSLKTAKNIPMGDLAKNPGKYLKKDNTYYLFCLSGARSKRTSSYLYDEGFEVVNLSGGIGSYRGANRK